MEKLSEDLLYSIFLYTLPSDFSWREPGLRPGIRTIAPFNFSLVCRSWRALVLSRPTLWASITIEDHPDVARRANRFCPIIEAWLRLSGTSPLTIRLRLGQPGNQSLGDLPIHLPPLFHQECYRWKDIDIGIYNDSLHEFNDTLELPTSSDLQFLSLHFSSVNQVFMQVNISPLVTGTSSNLRVLRIGEGASVCAAPQGKDVLHLPNLREFTSWIETGSDLDDTFSILSASPGLQKLYILDNATIPPTNTSRTKVVSLPNLTDFILTSHAPNTTCRLLGLLNCSALKTFIFRIYIKTRYLAVNEPALFCPTFDILRFFSCSRPPLVTLRLIYNLQNAAPSERKDEHANAVKELLGIVSDSLEQLVCNGSAVNSALIDALTDRRVGDDDDSSFFLCPSLSSIHLSCIPKMLDEELRSEAVEEMIASRWKGVKGSLKEVSIHLPGFGKFGEKSERLQMCVKEGLKASFS